jgi:Putative phage tail protein
MATVILSAVGTAIGGPIGGAIGSIIGQQLDRAILGSGPSREGPRIKELDVQTSSYGTQIPAIYGAMRVAGTVIWSTDLIEQRTKSGGSKSRPATVNYSYAASFAVALSSRPIARIGRIWADGNLLRGAAGDFKSETGFRMYAGYGDQALDPLLSAAEVQGQCPAYRGLACAIFEDFQLADYGNRIPSLTFEIFERETPVALQAIATDISAGVIVGNSNAALAGVAVQGSDCRAALSPLISALPVVVRTSGDRLSLSDWSSGQPEHLLGDAARSDGSEALDRPTRARHTRNRAPSSLSIRHYEPARDFQAGVQTSRNMGSAQNAEQIELPAALDAVTARGLANANLLQMWRGLNGVNAAVPITGVAIKAGDWLRTDDGRPPQRITEVEYLRGTARVVAKEWVTSDLDIMASDPGRNLSGVDGPIGQTRLIIADLPALSTNDPARTIVVVAAAGTAAGWRRAALSLVDGDREVELGATNGVAVIGHNVGEISPHSAMILDLQNQPVIRVLHDAMSLPVGSGDPTDFDAPMLWIGGEIIRYGNAEKIGVQEYRLSNLLRGCFSTNSDIVHNNQTPALLLDASSNLVLDTIPLPTGSTLVLNATGLADSVAVQASIPIAGNAIRPPAPVHGCVTHHIDGGVTVAWTRRDRLPHDWGDGADVPNSENAESYDIALYADGQLIATRTVAEPYLSLSAAEWDALPIAPATTLNFEIVQQGRFARSLPLTIACEP